MIRQAFSLVEVLIGLLVLAIALLALAAVPPVATRLFMSGADHEKAMSLAMNTLEGLEGEGSFPLSPDSGILRPYSDDFLVTWKVVGSDDHYQDVRVVVTWDALVGDGKVTVDRRLSRFAGP